MNLKQAIKAAQKGNPLGQRYLYEQYKVPLFTICLRYSRDRSEAEDMLQEGFIKIFKDLKQFEGRSEVGNWMKKVMVNTALQYLRKWKKDWLHSDTQAYQEVFQSEETVFHKLGLEELTRLIQKLPDGYKVVFNLFVVEGYSHREIAELLGISENTSKTQLFKAKAALRKRLEQQLLT
ncbi:MAG: sigma-70 family RNA polymerase sigma factor [Bacteroidota bacterium]